jgi:hypothetical protein
MAARYQGHDHETPDGALNHNLNHDQPHINGGIDEGIIVWASDWRVALFCADRVSLCRPLLLAAWGMPCGVLPHATHATLSLLVA